MAGDFGDFDRDGKLDLVVSRFGNQPVSLYRNQSEKGFAETTWDAKIGRIGYAPVKWGIGFADFDNDGWLDIFVANGNVSPKADQLANEAHYKEPIQLFRNLKKDGFEEVANESGINKGQLQSRRGLAFGDLKNDGNVDVVVYNVGEPPSVFLNETRNSNHRILLKLIGSKSNRSAIGARVTVHTSSAVQMAEITGGGSYLSSNDQRLHFGLGADSTIARVEIQWPSGAKDDVRDLATDFFYTIEEGSGVKGAVRLSNSGKAVTEKGK
jgi:hypothetical protein